MAKGQPGWNYRETRSASSRGKKANVPKSYKEMDAQAAGWAGTSTPPHDFRAVPEQQQQW